MSTTDTSTSTFWAQARGIRPAARRAMRAPDTTQPILTAERVRMTQFRTATMSTMSSTDIYITRTRSTVTTTGQYSSPEASRGGEDKDLDALPRHLQAPVRRVRARIEPPHRTRAGARLTDMGRVVVACLTMILLAAPTPARAGVPSEQPLVTVGR